MKIYTLVDRAVGFIGKTIAWRQLGKSQHVKACVAEAPYSDGVVWEAQYGRDVEPRPVNDHDLQANWREFIVPLTAKEFEIAMKFFASVRGKKYDHENIISYFIFLRNRSAREIQLERDGKDRLDCSEMHAKLFLAMGRPILAHKEAWQHTPEHFYDDRSQLQDVPGAIILLPRRREILRASQLMNRRRY